MVWEQLGQCERLSPSLLLGRPWAGNLLHFMESLYVKLKSLNSKKQLI